MLLLEFILFFSLVHSRPNACMLQFVQIILTLKYTFFLFFLLSHYDKRLGANSRAPCPTTKQIQYIYISACLSVCLSKKKVTELCR
ncbi:hypothetical protein J3Q64DRAFT_1729724 [Phycomyces blakesleeanus]|uniref:Secreted protein n=1 Tax=Phycomyces blakesleeanus TaxID=4837 RepID=A0ABR3B8Y8_PHYBL